MAERRAVALQTTVDGIRPDPISRTYQAYADLGLKQSGVVWACIAARQAVFADVELAWQRIGDRNLFRNRDLAILERPWPGGSTQDLLARMELDNSLGGGAFVLRTVSPVDGSPILQVLRPDKVDMILDGSRTVVVGYLYWEEGKHSGKAPVVLDVSEVAHYYTQPDPDHPYRGMSWLTPVLTEIEADKQSEKHKQAFFANAATPNLLVTVEKRIESDEARARFRAELDRRYSGWQNAYRTLILDDGADAKVIGQNMEQIQFTAVQAAGENRICVAARVPPIVAGVKEGLAAATYSNYGQAIRSFAALTIRPMWKNVAVSLQTIMPLPAGALRLWFDDSDVAAMREDAADEADVLAKKAQAVRTLTDAGYTAESAVAAIEGNDLTLLQHSGLFSVQLQPAGTPTVAPSGVSGVEE